MSLPYVEAMRYFTRELRDQHAAADLVQQSYVRILERHAGDMGEIRNLRALLFRTARHLMIDAHRRAQAEDRALHTLGVVQHDCAPSSEDVAWARQQLRRLTALLTRMPRKRRDTFILVRVYGYSHAEAAEHLRCSVAAVEKHVVRAVLDLADAGR